MHIYISICEKSHSPHEAMPNFSAFCLSLGLLTAQLCVIRYWMILMGSDAVRHQLQVYHATAIASATFKNILFLNKVILTLNMLTYFAKTSKRNLHILSFCYIVMARVVEILSHGRQWMIYSIQSVPRLQLHRWRKAQGNEQQCMSLTLFSQSNPASVSYFIQ